MKQISRVLGTLAAVAAAGVIARPAQAAVLQVSGNAPYHCAAVYGNLTANGTPVIASSCSGSSNEQWNFVNGQIEGLGSANGISMCLDAGNDTPGTLIAMNECNGSVSQQWVLGKEIVSVGGKYCVDSSGGPPLAGGTQLMVNSCNYANSQNWVWRAVELEVSSGGPYICANVQGGDTANGTAVVDYSCTESFNELWDYQNYFLYGLGTDSTTSTCLTANGTTVGSVVTLSTCSTTNYEQYWGIWNVGGSTSNAYSFIFSYPSGLCLNSEGGPLAGSDAQLIISTCAYTQGENWNLR